MKKITHILLGICMLVGMAFFLHTDVYAETLSTGKCGENLTYILDDKGTLTISGTGDMYGEASDNVEKSYDLFSELIESDDVINIVIGDGVTSISNGVFRYFVSLKKVKIGNGVITIGESAFSECYNLKEVVIGNQLTYIEGFAFSSCEKLKKFTLTSPDKLKKIGDGAFRECKKMKSFTFGDGLSYIGAWAFTFCDSLKKVVIGSSLSYIDYGAFENCTYLDEVIIENPNSLTHIDDYAFWRTSLNKFKIGKNVSYIGERAFCSSWILLSAGREYSEKEIDKIYDRNIIWGLDLYVHRDNKYAINHFKKLKCDEYVLYPKFKGPSIKVKSKKGKITIKYSKVKNAKKYYIVVKGKNVKKTFSTKSLKYIINNINSSLKKGKKYKIKVRAKLKNGEYTKYSKTKKVKVK